MSGNSKNKVFFSDATMTDREVLLAFIIGSSIPVTLVSFLYLGIAFKKAGRPSAIPYELFAILIPVLFGLFNILNVYLLKLTDNKNVSIYVGVFQGLVFSIIGRFLLDLPGKLFKMEQQYLAHVYAIVTYMIISRIIVHPINVLLIFPEVDIWFGGLV